MTSKKIRVIVVDDSAFMRNMLVRMIARDERFEIIASASNGQEGVDLVAQHKPDVVTMDVEMPVMNGLEALTRIMEATPTPVIMISTLTDAGAKVTMEALEKGAVDFMPKSLQDADKNVFKSAEPLYEKIIAASQAQVKALAATSVRAIAADKTRPQTAIQYAADQPGTMAPTTTPAAPPVNITSPVSALHSAKLLVIGSSTGGPRALTEVIKTIPKTLRVPGVVAQHMPPGFTKALAERLNECGGPKVKELQAGETLVPGTIYIAPGGLHTRLSTSGTNFVVNTAEDKGESFYRPSVDVLAQTAQTVAGKDVLAVMLTGMGADGADGFLKLRKAGAHVIGQNAETCVVYGMPKAVVDNGAVNEVLPLADIGKRIGTLLA